MSKTFFNRLYTRVPSAEGLPWHRDYPPKFLSEALAEKSAPATALDVGCGAGTYSLFMSKSGYDVTAIDFIEKALDMARDSTTAYATTAGSSAADTGIDAVSTMLATAPIRKPICMSSPLVGANQILNFLNGTTVGNQL